MPGRQQRPISPYPLALKPTGPVDHIAFAAQDYDEVLARLQRQGVHVRANDNPGNVVRQLFLFDPNGVKIEINLEWLSLSPMCGERETTIAALREYNPTSSDRHRRAP